MKFVLHEGTFRTSINEKKARKKQFNFVINHCSLISIDSYTARFATPPTHPMITRSWSNAMEDYDEDLRNSPTYESDY